MGRILTKIRAFFVISLVIRGISIIGATESLKTTIPNNKPTAPEALVSKASLKSGKKGGKLSVTTLPKIVQEALKHHPNIEADKEAFSATDDLIDQARAGYMPAVDLRVSLGRDTYRRNFRTNLLTPTESIGNVSTTRSDPSITIRQILFDGMGIASRVAKAYSQRDQARGTLGVTTDTAIIDAASAVIDLRRLHRLLDIVENNIRFHQTMKAKIQEIVDAGATSISDLFQVESRLQDTLISKANILSDLEAARVKFIEVVGKEPPDYIKRIHLPSYLSSTSSEMAVRMALDNNNSLKVAKSNVQIAEANYEESASKLLPTVTLEFEGERDRNMGGTSGSQSRVTAMLVARHNLFSGGGDLARSRESAKRLAEAKARLNIARRQIERTVRSAWGEAKNARVKSIHLTNLIREKRLIRASYLEEFTLGKRTLIDILDAANDVFITEATRTNADAAADVNIVTLSVHTSQFKGYMNRAEENDEKENKDEIEDSPTLTSYTPNLEKPSLTPSTYTATPQKELLKVQKINKSKKTPIKRKSIFDLRKESRNNALLDKESA